MWPSAYTTSTAVILCALDRRQDRLVPANGSLAVLSPVLSWPDKQPLLSYAGVVATNSLLRVMCSRCHMVHMAMLPVELSCDEPLESLSIEHPGKLSFAQSLRHNSRTGRVMLELDFRKLTINSPAHPIPDASSESDPAFLSIN